MDALDTACRLLDLPLVSSGVLLSADDIADAFKHQARQHHPDKKPPEQKDAATAHFQRLAAARDLLLNYECGDAAGSNQEAAAVPTAQSL
eukprot:SAG31_NODE_26846_length_435_cov_1.080357_1_plen_89_part_10